MANTFTPRLTSPSTSNKWYLHTSKGGYNNSILVGSPSVLANCVGYARGRFSEIAGSWQNIANSDGGKVWSNTSGFQKGSKPKLGAIICWSKPGAAGHVAVVEKVNPDGSIVTSESGYKELPFSSITTADGHYNGKAFWTGKYSPDNGYCSGSYIFQGFIYNPAIVGDEIVINSDGTDDGGFMSMTIANLYEGQELSGKEDAVMREVAYVDSRSEPSILSTDIKLSVINYTSALAAIFNTMVKPTFTLSNVTSDVILDNLDSVKREIIQFFIDKGFPASAGVGVLANIYHESSCRTNALGDYKNGVPTSFGICQWHNERGTNMKNYVGSNWASNLTGQLNFLYHELSTGYSTLVALMKSAPNNADGAASVADAFVRKFERPARVDSASAKRQSTARDFWSRVVPQLT